MIKYAARKSPIFLYLILFSVVVWMTGCGGSSIQNPIQDSEENTDNLSQVRQQTQPLNVNVDVSKATVQQGETVTMTATVDGIRGTRLLLNWVNVTGYGELSIEDQNNAIWTAPQTLDSLDIKVEVIQLIVTGVSQVVSVKKSGVDTDTEILTGTKTVLLTVTPN